MVKSMSARDELICKLRAIGACKPALTWLESLSEHITLKEAWDLCINTDWLKWLIENCTGEILSSDKDVKVNHKCPDEIPEPCDGDCGYTHFMCCCFDDEWNDEEV